MCEGTESLKGGEQGCQCRRQMNSQTPADILYRLTAFSRGAVCRYRLDADSPCAMRDRGQRDRRRQLEKAVSQGNKAVVKVTFSALTSPTHRSLITEKECTAFIHAVGRLVHLHSWAIAIPRV